MVGDRSIIMEEMDIHRLIELHDQTLDELRREWLAATDPKKKQAAMVRIDNALDYRLKLMDIRDSENGSGNHVEILK